MKRSKVFFINAVILAAASILIQAIDVWFKVYVTNLAGAQAMGMFQLIMSVYAFALTLAMSGINLAATRLVAEEIGKKNGNISAALKNCILYALFFGCFSAFILFSLSDMISEKWLFNPKASLSLKLLSVSLPFISVSSVLTGYFTAVRRVIKSASAAFLDMLLKTLIAVFIFSFFSFDDISSACVCIVLSAVIAEVLSFLYEFALFKMDRKKFKSDREGNNDKTGKRMFKIALPVAFSAYVRSGLLSIEHLMIPVSLRKFGSSFATSLSVYGIIHGIVLPVLLFPSAIVGAFSGLLIPEISENMATKGKLSDKNQKHSVTDIRTNYIIRRVYQITLTFAIGVCAVFMFFSEEILVLTSNKSPETAFYIKILALMVPIMYLDNVTDSFLKALNEQVNSMIYNIIDSFICVVLVIVLLPLWGIKGYIVILYLSEMLNAFLSISRLVTIADFTIDVKRLIILPIFSALISAGTVKSIYCILCQQPGKLSVLLLIAAYAFVYIGILIITKSIKKEDIVWAVSIFKKEGQV